ncbi:hypothetical protein [Haloferax sp. ATB1]|nr:hypothetical protein [Haloferax sp. ATB1]
MARWFDIKEFTLPFRIPVMVIVIVFVTGFFSPPHFEAGAATPYFGL